MIWVVLRWAKCPRIAEAACAGAGVELSLRGDDNEETEVAPRWAKRRVRWGLLSHAPLEMGIGYPCYFLPIFYGGICFEKDFFDVFGGLYCSVDGGVRCRRFKWG